MSKSIIYGKYPVKNSFLGKSLPLRVLLNEKHPDQEIILLCKKMSVPYELLSVEELDRRTDNQNHQGCLAVLREYSFSSLDDVIKDDDKNHTIVILDGIQDPVNFASIIRSSVAFDVDGIIISKRNQVGMTPTVRKIATGAEELIDIVQVDSLIDTIKKIRKNNYWIISSAGEGKDYYNNINYQGKFALVIGSEGNGVSPIIRKLSDYVASIPLPGKVKALNASIACAVFLSEINSFRFKNK